MVVRTPLMANSASALREAGSERLPADARHARRLAARDGVEIADSVHSDLPAMLQAHQ
jgi:hypothetical protein